MRGIAGRAREWSEYSAEAQHRWRERQSSWFPSLRQRRRRRAAVLCHALLAASLVVTTASVDSLGDAFLLVYLPVYLLCVLSWFLLRVLTNTIAESMTTTLDEWERTLRDRLTHVSFQLVIPANLCVAAYLVVTADSPRSAVSGAAVLAAVTFLLACLPTVLLAWMLPDEDADIVDVPPVPPADAGPSRPTEPTPPGEADGCQGATTSTREGQPVGMGN
ncbi:hypothetical protein [Actinoalloteichus caeruleus]|uniref:Uncharacterized protein n=1 Tax=Actinoalloteichus caeruleus DSM 43889 TaxID=1120930 RepID=A0ABT1JJ26_ACTCY|nr:hypothetical protein [Actinoalloteichus caeruleus]MCP2332511.1 hypothetical protein [Actinoalloteichus caeruleus DSM 43889]